jgi:hypothetical protein
LPLALCASFPTCQLTNFQHFKVGDSMYKISTINLVRKMGYSVWNVVFQMDDNPLQYTTDFLYLFKEKKWVFNSIITHELTSLMEGHRCIYCQEDKIACFVASSNFQKIKQEITGTELFLKEVSSEISLQVADIPTDYLVINDLNKWAKLAEENRFYGNLLRIQSRNK